MSRMDLDTGTINKEADSLASLERCRSLSSFFFLFLLTITKREDVREEKSLGLFVFFFFFHLVSCLC